MRSTETNSTNKVSLSAENAGTSRHDNLSGINTQQGIGLFTCG